MLVRQSFCDALVPVLNYGFKSFKLFGKHHFWDFLEKVRAQTQRNFTTVFTPRSFGGTETEHSFVTAFAQEAHARRRLTLC